MPKISALPPMTTADAADEAPIVDTSVSTTKKWTLTLLKTYLQSLAAWITTAMIADSAATTRKVKLSVIDYRDAGGSNFTTTSGTAVDITGMSTTYTTGPTNEKIFVFVQGMVLNSAVASGQVTLNINGVSLMATELAAYIDETTWDRVCYLFIADIPANTTATIKAIAQNSGGNTLTWHRGAPYVGAIRGFAISNV